LTLQVAVDWKVGESIVIASTNLNAKEAEQRMITAIDRSNPSKPILTLDKELVYKHFASTEVVGDGEDDFIDIRAEVGLLSRNVRYRGDPETS
jgi:hypothetical protein